MLAQSVAGLNLSFQGAGLGASNLKSNLQICKISLKFGFRNDRAKYREMIFGVVQIKFSVG